MNNPKLKFITSMLIFGSVGLFVRLLPFSSAQVALGRGLIGCLFLLLFMVIMRKPLSFKRIRADLWLLILSGTAIGINWILLFQSYHYTSIANATICYYLAPVFVVMLSPLLLKEKLTARGIICIAAALLGVVLITGSGGYSSKDLIGIFYGIGAAAFYAAVILTNKFFRAVTNMERTIVQLAAATLSLFPYVLLADPWNGTLFTLRNLLILAAVGIIHTGLSYYLYFSGLSELKGQSAALLSYIDPLAAILLSALMLGESLQPWQILGGAFILGSALANDLLPWRKAA